MHSKSIAVLKNKFLNKKNILLFLSLSILSGCFSSSRVMIPESLPPDAYARESVSTNDNLSVITPERIPPRVEESRTEKRSFLDYRLKKTERSGSQIEIKNQQNSNYTFRVKAIDELWVWVQDKNGNEVAWEKMMNGSEFLIYKSPPLTLTCSKPNAVVIYDQKGKKVSYPPSVNPSTSINIIRIN